MRLAITLLIALAACTTLRYRDIQAEFNDAVAEDNASIQNPLFTPTGGYDAVLARLTPESIGRLDAKLRANAWMLRAYSAWRTGDLQTAKSAADEGTRIAPEHSRDRVALLAVYGLVADTEVMTAWQAVETRDKAAYDRIEPDLATAWRKLADAEAAIGAATPKSMESFVSYQKWRVAANWAGVIASCKAATRQERNQMRADAETHLGKEPQDAADAARDKVKGVLRQLIAAQGG